MLTRNRVQRGARFRVSAMVIWIATSILISSPAVADDIQDVPEPILNLDLCTLAYQFYHQSLCLPLDPWYDVMSRVASSRRDNICRFTHEYAEKLGGTANGVTSGHGFYSGPNAARNWNSSNLNLDPILTNYKYIDAKAPTFNRDGSHFLAVLAPDYVTRNIKVIEGIRYKTKPTTFPSTDVERFPIRQYQNGSENGSDHLVVFEGGTGIANKSDPSWSLMGFVLMKQTRTGYDAHIVFRGSRSGAALSTTVWKAQALIGDPKGNPDWITDLRSDKQMVEPLISKNGMVTEGFAESLPTMLGPIAASCKYLSQNYPVPEHIYVSGHSLGAGLASQFTSAVLQGTYGDSLRSEVKTWPWNNTTLIAYAQPIPGNPAWAASFDKISPASEHYWVAGDMVVEANSNSIVSKFIDAGEHGGVQHKLDPVADCSDNVHEVFVIRAAMLRDLASKNKALSQRLGNENTWAYYKTFSKMLAGEPESYMYPGAPTPNLVTEQNLRRILKNGNFSTEFDNWLEEVYAKMIAEKSSYIGFKLQSTLDERRRLVTDLVGRMRKEPGDSDEEIASLVSDYKLIDGNLGLTDEERWIFCGDILSRLERSKISMKELVSKPEIKTCLDSL